MVVTQGKAGRRRLSNVSRTMQAEEHGQYVGSLLIDEIG